MRLDLNKLENKLDEALNNETSETLSKFLNDKRMSNKQQTAVDFVPYELALELKQLGFDEPCNTCYDKLEMVASYGASVFDYKNYNTSGYMVSSPTYSQAFRWFREKYNIDVSINTVYSKYNENTSKKYGGVTDNESVFTNVGFYNTYEEAELACLKKLIEITNDKQ